MHNLILKLVLMFFDYKAVVFLVEPSKNLYYTQGYRSMSKCVTVGGAHLRDLAPGQQPKKRQSGSNPLATLSVYDLTGLEIELLSPRSKAMSLPLYTAASNALKIKLLLRNNRVIAHKI